MSSLLADYLKTVRDKQEAEQTSPQELLEAMEANTGNTADLTGKLVAEARKQTNAVMGSADAVRDSVQDSRMTMTSFKRVEEAGLKASHQMNERLAEIAKQLKQLTDLNRTLVKQTAPPPNSKDDTYSKRVAVANEVAPKKESRIKTAAKAAAATGTSILSDVADVFSIADDIRDWRKGRAASKEAAKIGPPKPSGLSKAGGFGRVKGAVGSAMGSIGNFAGRVGTALESGGGRLSGLPKAIGTVGTKATEAAGAAKGLAGRAVEATGRAWSSVRGVGEEAVESAAKYGTRAWEATQGARSAVGRAATATKSVAGKALGAVGDFGGKALDAGRGLASRAVNAGSELVGGAKTAGKSLFGTVGGMAKASGVLSLGTAAFDEYNLLTDDTKTTKEKAVGTAGIGGGAAGGIAGAELGAAIGTVIAPGIGTAIGGALGGIGGYLSGTELATSVAESLSSAVSESGLGDVIGAGVAVAISPFSEDAREALRKDFGPKVEELGQTMTKTGDRIEKGTADLLLGWSKTLSDFGSDFKAGFGAVGVAAAATWSGAKQTAAAVGDATSSTAGAAIKGYKEGGWSGALESGKTAASNALGQVGDVFSNVTGIGNTRQYKDAAGNTEVREGGTRAWRNNNEGNIRYGDFAKAKGAIGQDAQGFAIFANQEAGAKAKESLLFEGKNYKDKSIDDAIARYAPSSENDTAAYQKRVREAAGLKGSEKMSDLTPEQRQKVLSAMKQQEGFREGKTKYVDASGKEISKEQMAVAVATQHGTTPKGNDPETARLEAIKLARAEAATNTAPPKPKTVPTETKVAQAPIETKTASTDQTSKPEPVPATPTTKVMPQQVASTEPEIVRSRREAFQKVNPSTPEETKKVVVANPDEVRPPPAPATVHQTEKQLAANNQPDLSSIPVVINDLGLVLVNLGHC